MFRVGAARHAVDVEAELRGLVGAPDDSGDIPVCGDAHTMSHARGQEQAVRFVQGDAPKLHLYGPLDMVMKRELAAVSVPLDKRW